MRTLWTVLSIVLLVNVIALGGFVMWLSGSGRLTKERLERIVAVLSKTVDQENAEKADADAAKKKEEESHREAARLERIADGPAQLAQQIAQDQEKNEIAMQRYERLKRDIEDLRRANDVARRLLDEERAKLDAQRKAFDLIVQQERARLDDQDFKQAVQMYESLKAKQVKDLFRQLMQQNKSDEVLRYLGAMQLRKAAAVLTEFKTPQETAEAADIIQRMRERGVDLLSPDRLSAAPEKAP